MLDRSFIDLDRGTSLLEHLLGFYICHKRLQHLIARSFVFQGLAFLPARDWLHNLAVRENKNRTYSK